MTLLQATPSSVCFLSLCVIIDSYLSLLVTRFALTVIPLPKFEGCVLLNAASVIKTSIFRKSE